MTSRTNEQEKAIEQFTKLKVGALFMQMGSGKTRVAIELANYNSTRFDTILFIAPHMNIVKGELQNEINKWKPTNDCLTISYETLSQSDSKYLQLLDKVKDKKLFIVADESIFIKNEQTKRFKRLMNLAKYSEYRLILCGTPITKNEWDLYNQMHFLSPKIIGMSRDEFLNNFFKKVSYLKKTRKGYKAKEYYKFSQVNAKYLKTLIAPYVYECDLNLDIKEISETITVSNSSSKSYLIKKEALLNGIWQSKGVVRYLVGLAKVNALDINKNKRVIDYIKNKQIICYCSYIKEAEEIARNAKAYLITGKTPSRIRADIFKQFEFSQKPLVMTFGVGSFGLNLQFCNQIVFSSLMFDYAKVLQAQFRIKRLGQKQEIIYTYFKTDLRICNLIEENIKKKQSLHDLVKQELDWEKVS